MIFYQMVQNWIGKLKIKMPLKVAIYIGIFLYVLNGNMQEFINNRPKTLFDHLNIERNATFDEIKSAKDFYLNVIREKDDPLFEGDLSSFENYTMTEETLGQVYYVLTNHHLREAYDKHNQFYK